MQTALNGLSTSGAPVLLDGNNNVLGVSTSEGSFDFFDKQLKVIVPVDTSGSISSVKHLLPAVQGPYFTSSDCTGTAYATNYTTGGPDTLLLYSAYTTSPGHYDYFIAKDDAQNTQMVVNSMINSSSNCLPVNNGGTVGVTPLTLVSINFTDPIVMPIHFQ